MRQSVTDSHVPGGASDQHPGVDQPVLPADAQDIVYPPMDSETQFTAPPNENAREIAARHLARLMYSPVNTWSRYTFHENDPHPYGG